MTDINPFIGSNVSFTKFDGGNIVGSEGVLTEVTPEAIKLTVNDVVYSFRRAPGSKCGWGIGAAAKNWRLSGEARAKLCLPDLPTRRH